MNTFPTDVNLFNLFYANNIKTMTYSKLTLTVPVCLSASAR